MGMAGRRRKRRSENRLHPQPGQPHVARPLSHLRQRCLGARLLPQIQQPPSRVSASLVERSQLGRNQQALPVVSEEVTFARVGTGASPVPAEQSSAARLWSQRLWSRSKTCAPPATVGLPLRFPVPPCHLWL